MRRKGRQPLRHSSRAREVVGANEPPVTVPRIGRPSTRWRALILARIPAGEPVMRPSALWKCLSKVSFSALIVASIGLTFPAFADPPDRAPAHGWRKKHDPYYLGYTGHKWERDYGIVEGRCNREAIGTVVGAVAGGAIGSQVADREDRAVAIVIGAVIGAVIGHEIGRSMDDRDFACVGHTLELAKGGQRLR